MAKMSIGSVVIIVLAITMLVLILVLVKNFKEIQIELNNCTNKILVDFNCEDGRFGRISTGDYRAINNSLASCNVTNKNYCFPV